MRVTGFPNCCAGLILSDFGGTGTTDGTSEDIDITELESWLKKTEASYYKKFLVIAINDEQEDVMGNVLLKHGYTCVGSNMKSPGHQDSEIFLYLKHW